MSTRCKACDKELVTVSWNKWMGDWDDLCPPCRTYAKQGFVYVRDHRHVLNDAQDGQATEPWDASHQ